MPNPLQLARGTEMAPRMNQHYEIRPHLHWSRVPPRDNFLMPYLPYDKAGIRWAPYKYPSKIWPEPTGPPEMQRNTVFREPYTNTECKVRMGYPKKFKVSKWDKPKVRTVQKEDSSRFVPCFGKPIPPAPYTGCATPKHMTEGGMEEYMNIRKGERSRGSQVISERQWIREPFHKNIGLAYQTLRPMKWSYGMDEASQTQYSEAGTNYTYEKPKKIKFRSKFKYTKPLPEPIRRASNHIL